MKRCSFIFLNVLIIFVQVFGMAESAFLTILEHCLIQDEDVEHRVWPVIENRLKSPNLSSFQDNLFETHNRVISVSTFIFVLLVIALYRMKTSPLSIRTYFMLVLR
jgi:hypothetical protein